jgi:hypothetical protein
VKLQRWYLTLNLQIRSQTSLSPGLTSIKIKLNFEQPGHFCAEKINHLGIAERAVKEQSFANTTLQLTAFTRIQSYAVHEQEIHKRARLAITGHEKPISPSFVKNTFEKNLSATVLVANFEHRKVNEKADSGLSELALAARRKLRRSDACVCPISFQETKSATPLSKLFKRRKISL